MPDHRPIGSGERTESDGPHPDRRIWALAERQHGVVSRRQLLAAGLTASAVKRRVARRRLIPLHPGVFAVGHRQLRREGHWLAAVLAVGDGAVLSHRQAAALHGIRPANTDRVDVSAPGRHVARRGIRVHGRRALDPADVTVVAGIPATTLARTLVDLAWIVPRTQLLRALSEAEHVHRLDARALAEAAARARGRHGGGHAALREVLREHRAAGVELLRSELEARFLALVAAHELPRPRMNVPLGGYEVDALWPAERLVVELDGYAHHSDRLAFERDRAKGNALSAASYVVLRFTYAQVARRPSEVAATVAHMLRGRSVT
jgi:very-short-patch-repair endonuclease